METTLEPRGIISHPAQVKAKAFTMYRKKKSLDDIARVLGVPKDTVSSWSTRGKWKARALAMSIQQSRRDATASDQLPRPTQAREIDGLTLEEQQAQYRGRMATEALRLPLLLRAMDDATFLASADKIKKLDEVARKALSLESDGPSVVVNVALLAGTATSKTSLTSGSAETSDALVIEGEHTGCIPVAIKEPSLTLPENTQEEG